MRHNIVSALRVSVLAIVISFGLSYALAWTAPTVTPPNGNVSAPINTSATDQTKAGDFCTTKGGATKCLSTTGAIGGDITVGNITASGTITSGGDICSVIAGVKKCLSTTSALVPTATVSASAATCTITSGNSGCMDSFTWNIANATTPNLYNGTAGTQLSALASGTNVSYSMSYGSNTVQARDGSTALASASVTASCATGLNWNGSSCQPTSATIVVNKPTGELVIVCQIPDGGSTCPGGVTWSVSNAGSPNLYNATAGTQIVAGTGATTPVTLAHGLNWFSVRDNTTQLASDSGTAICSGEGTPSLWGIGMAFWNGSICDPAWVAKASMPTARGNASTATLNNKIYVFGGTSGGTVEEYDPATNSWATRTSMLTPRALAGAATVGTKIYIIGGYDAGGVNSTKNEEYSPMSDTWATKLPLLTAEFGTPAVTVGTKIYYMSYVVTRVYDPSLNTWTTKLAIPSGRRDTAAVAVGTDIYVLGGNYCSNINMWTTCNTNEKYDTLTNTWSTKASMGTYMYLEGHTAAVVNGKIYVTGGRAGYSNGANNLTQEYNPITNTWRARATYDYRLYATTAVVNNKIYVIGQGYGWGYTPSGYNTEYDPAKDLTP